jgi:septal ring factor EnvC (AmiA/AmiB activator)
MYKVIKLVTVAVFLIGGLGFVGCTKYASDEELKQLSDKQAEVTSQEDNIRKLQAEKANLEKQVAEKNGKLKQCQADQEAVKKAMGK